MRSYSRFSTDQEINCRIGRKKRTVKLYNLSSGGCMIECDSEDVVQGDAVQIDLRGKATMPGQIVWRVGKNAGIKFEIPLHGRVVQLFGYAQDEEFDRHDPRDRFGIPLIN